MHGRELPPLRVHEFTAEVLVEALEFHMGRLKRTMDEARNRADRHGWALAYQKRSAVHSLWMAVKHQREMLGPMSEEDQDELESIVTARGRTMPRSAANAEALKAEAAVRRGADEARKVSLREERARHKRFTGIGPEA